MKRHPRNSVEASALLFTLTVALVAISAILIATSFRAAASGESQNNNVLQQDGFFPPLPVTTPAPVGLTPTPPPCTIMLSENFDGVTPPFLPPGWVASNPIPGDGVLWTTSAFDSDSLPNNAFINDQDGVSDKVLDSPDIQISASPATIAFRNNFNTEFSDGVYWDGGVLEVSSPNISGGKFVDITDPQVGGSFIVGGYTGEIVGDTSNPLSGRFVWSGNSGGYIDTVANLGPNVVGQTIRLRFRIGTDAAVAAPGWRIDNIVVSGGDTCPTPWTCGSFANTASISIGDSGPGSPYPSSTNVSGLGGSITRVWVKINGLTHPRLIDLDVLLVAPGGQNAIIMSDSGGSASNVSFTIADGYPPLSHLVNGRVYGPTNSGTGDQFPTPAPSPSGTVALSTFNGTNPNGTWSLYVFDDSGGNSGAITGGWELHILTNDCSGPTPTPPTPTPTPPTPTPTPIPTPTATPTPTPEPATLLMNVSTRLRVLTADKVLIGGFIVNGTAPKRALLRGIGPSLTGFGVPGALVDPVLELHGPSGFSTVINDNWRKTQETEIEETGLAPANDLESAIVALLPPGAYTGIVHGANDGIGVGLVEVYDLDATVDAKLANISTRGFVDSGDNAMIGGLILGNGNGTAKVLIRAIGPSLGGVGVTDPLADPTLNLYNGQGTQIATNDNWKDTQQPEIEATGIPPSDDRESAILGTLVPGAYTAVVRGKNDTTGVGLVEAYQLATPTPTPSATPLPTASPTPTPTPTTTPTSTPGPTASDGFVILSSRALVGTGESVAINALIISGPVPKQILLRGIGPSLAGGDALPDPVLELHGPEGFETIINNNWRDTQEAEIIATGIPPTNDLEAAILVTLNPASYTVILRGNGGLTGYGANEIYDMDLTGASALSAVGTRANALFPSDILIGGITLPQLSNGKVEVVVRGLGRSLAVTSPLHNPFLQLRDSQGVIVRSNDDWLDSPAQAAAITAAGLAPDDILEAALVEVLSPGVYIAVEYDFRGSTGIGYVQFYILPHSGPQLP